MQSLQHYARLTIWNNDVDYSHLPQNVYLSLGLPNVEVSRFANSEKEDPDVGLTISAKVGCMYSLMFFKSVGATAYRIEVAMEKAARNGHIEIVKQCKEWGARSFNVSMERAAAGGHIEIVILCKSWGADYFRWTWAEAAYNGHYDIVKLLLECDDTDHSYINEAMEWAAYRGHIDIIRLCKENGTRGHFKRYKRALLVAAEYGHIEIVKMYKEWGFDRYLDDAMETAALHGHIEIVKLCNEYGAVICGWTARNLKNQDIIDLLDQWKDTHYDWMMIEAALYGDVELLKESKAKGAVEYNRALKWAAWYGYIEIVTLLHSWGANDFNSAIRKVSRSHGPRCFELLKMFKEWKVDIDFDKVLAVTANNEIRSFLIEWSLQSIYSP
jgi:hypothetical protein